MGEELFKAGDFLYGIPSCKESEEYNPEGERVFIYTGQYNADGYGILIGWEDHKIRHSSGYGNWQWGGKVRLATEQEKKQFMKKLMNSDYIRYR